MTVNREDPFAGVWKLNPEKSHFDPSHCASGGTMYWEPTSEGYRMRAEGTKSDGQVVEEKPQTFILDDKDHPLADVPGVTAIASRPLRHALPPTPFTCKRKTPVVLSGRLAMSFRKTEPR
jgi:hypothetical protein